MIVVQFTTVHTRTDTRIRIKQAASLAGGISGKVLLFVQDGKGSETDKSAGVQVIDTGPKPGNRFIRMALGALCMLRAVRKARPNVAHFHDPELIPAGLVLKLSGIKVIYDVHEDVPKQILGKYYLPLVVRKPVAWAMEAVEWIAGRCFDAIVPATPEIAKRFPPEKTMMVQNFPILQELVAPKPVPYESRPPYFAYVGGITRARGAEEMVEAISRVSSSEAKLLLTGAFSPKNLQSEIEALPGWKKVDFLGWADRKQVANLLGNVRAGLVLFHPGPNHCSAQPNKMFEYMAAGLPVIASDFSLWREIVDGAGCGLLVAPMDPEAIAEAMQWILEHPAESEAMGRRGRQAVKERYNWEQEAKKLIRLYRRLLEK
jgi:hypothetical protein